MLTLAAIQKSTLSVKFGFSIDNDTVQAILGNPVNFETEIPKYNVPLVIAPAISQAKVFDPAKPAYIGVSVSEDKKYINLTLTNVKPDNDIEKNKPIMALFTTRYDDKDRKTIEADALKAVNALYTAKK